MLIKHIPKALMVCFMEQKALELVGPFGIGKSTSIRDFTDTLTKMNFTVQTRLPDGTVERHQHRKGEPVGLVECLVPTFAVEDIRGFPMPDYEKGEMFYSVPPFFPSSRTFPNGIPKFGIIFLDEYRLGPDEVVKATTQLLLEGRIGDHSLTQYGHWVVFAASNREEDRVGIGKEAPIITQRKFVVEIEPHIDATVKWLEANEERLGVPPVVRFFARENPAIVFSKVPDDGKPFCSPRSLVEAGQVLQRYMKIINYEPKNKYDIPSTDDFVLELMAGKIGEGAAAQLQQYARMVGQVPAYGDIIERPKSAVLPGIDRPDAAFVTITLIEHQAGDYSRDPKTGEFDVERMDKEIDSLVTYLMRLPAEFQVTSLRRTFKKVPSIYSHPKIAEIAQKNPSLLKAISD
jgi:hypothetical protein